MGGLRMDGLIYIDATEVLAMTEKMRDVLSADNFNKVMARTYKRVAGGVGTILSSELPKKYEVKAGAVGAAVGKPQIEGITCRIPIKGTRWHIGGQFKVVGARGRPRKGAPLVVRARIVKSGVSTLPKNLPEWEFGQPVFLINKVAFARRFKHSKKPIMPVVGIGIPQMPLNRSREDFMAELKTRLEKELTHQFDWMMRSLAGETGGGGGAKRATK